MADTKKQKTEDTKEVEETKEPPKELEEDAKKDKGDKIKSAVTFLTPDTTMNVLPSTVGNMLGSLQDGGLGSLVAGARANVGIKSGRYMFEAKIVESGGTAMFRIGLSTEGSLFLGEDASSICFDNQGSLISNKKKTKPAKSFAQDIIVAVVLNLDPTSPNFNTISLFKDGVRASEPQPLPDELKDQTLFPSFSYKGVTVHYNFGPPIVPLPFTCKVVSEALVKDVSMKDQPEGGTYTAHFPVCLPDEGSFDALDSFLQKNPDYTEISDRALQDWQVKSGLGTKAKAASNDKPDANHDFTPLKNTLIQIAALQPRNLVVMEVKANLVKEDRIAALAKFKSPAFKTVAEVLVGTPPSSFKKTIHEKLLKAKQDASDAQFKVEQAKKKREWMARKKTKEAEKAKKKADKERQKKMEEIKKKREEALKKAKKDMAAKAGETVEEEEEKAEEEEKKEEEPEEEEPEEPEPQDEEPPTVELNAEEKAITFFKGSVPDLAPYVLNTSFASFSLPTADEGFTSVKFSWSKKEEAIAYAKQWVLAKKQTTRVEDIKPSQWFKDKLSSWNSSLTSWKNKQNEYKTLVAKKAAEKQAKLKKKEMEEKKAKMEAEKKAKEAEAKKAKEGEEEKAEEKEEEKEEVKPVEVEVEEEPEDTVDFEGVDVFGVEDVLDIGAKTPLFKEFQFEDFALMSLRAELHFMAHSFGKDVEDPDRTGVHMDHLAFYYQKYFGKTLSAQSFGVKTVLEMVQLVSDTVHVEAKTSVLESLIPADLETHAVFIKLTEEARRQRLLAIEMGDDSAKLNIQKQQGEKRSWDGSQKQGGGNNQDAKTGESKDNKRKWEGGGKGGGKWGKWGGKW